MFDREAVMATGRARLMYPWQSPKQAAKDIWFILHARRASRALARFDQAPASQLALALREFARFSADAPEREWLWRCERFRQELCGSEEKVRMRNFGKEAETGQLHFDEYTLGELCRVGAKPYVWNFLLFRLIRSFRPLRCLEIGTSIGVSTSFQSAALTLNGAGTIETLEGSEDLSRAADRHLSSLGISCARGYIGEFQVTLPEVLRVMGTIDYAFIDGHLEPTATLRYFEMIKPYLSDNALYVCSWIRWSEGMHSAWNKIIADPCVVCYADVYKYGVVVLNKK
ncbi:MAG: class I SAM-dependent methyltransferase [Candidatus Hydrogenedentes bacterium]|nr:class I SAM-dependent methyltransferase [Candidatus Hydrogenedentota bacterium]